MDAVAGGGAAAEVADAAVAKAAAAAQRGAAVEAVGGGELYALKWKLGDSARTWAPGPTGPRTVRLRGASSTTR